MLSIAAWSTRIVSGPCAGLTTAIYFSKWKACDANKMDTLHHRADNQPIQLVRSAIVPISTVRVRGVLQPRVCMRPRQAHLLHVGACEGRGLRSKHKPLQIRLDCLFSGYTWMIYCPLPTVVSHSDKPDNDGAPAGPFVHSPLHVPVPRLDVRTCSVLTMCGLK